MIKVKKKREKKFVIYGAEKNQTPLVPPPKRNAMRWLSKKKKKSLGGRFLKSIWCLRLSTIPSNKDVLIQPPSLDQRHLVRHEAGRVHEAHQAGSAQAYKSAAVAGARAVDGLDEAVLRAVQDQGYEERVGDGYEECERLTRVPDCVLSDGGYYWIRC